MNSVKASCWWTTRTVETQKKQLTCISSKQFVSIFSEGELFELIVGYLIIKSLTLTMMREVFVDSLVRWDQVTLAKECDLRREAVQVVKAAGFSFLYCTGELNFNSFVPCGFVWGGERCLRDCLPNSKQSVSKTGDNRPLKRRLKK